MNERTRRALVAQGHAATGHCEKCWAVAHSMYAGGQSGYESLVDAYAEALADAESAVAAIDAADPLPQRSAE